MTDVEDVIKRTSPMNLVQIHDVIGASISFHLLIFLTRTQLPPPTSHDVGNAVTPSEWT